MHKLTNMEAQRVIAVLEDTIERLALISLIPTTPDVELLERVPDVSDAPLKAAIQQQWQIEESHRVLHDHHATGNATSEELADQFSQSTRTLCRQMRKNYPAIAALKEHSGTARSAHLLNCQQYLSDLTAVIFRRLSTTVEEETANKHMLHELTEKERNAAEEASALQETLETQRTEREREVSVQDQTLTKLRAELHDITQTNQSKMDLVRIQMEDQITKSEEEHKLASHQLMEKISGLESTIESQSQINRDTEAALRKKKERIEADLATQVV
mmetsp:Transcript_31818/g.103384  ORF Transcript_31818/g.103384 Transcript_31818/m.103384 type:complete len:273 (-) Transcript_31818:751-1569(-)